MKLYIVRHAESTSNALKIHQGDEKSLSEKGIRQAQQLGERISKINDIDLIVCSPFLRTKQTLNEILKFKELPVVFSDLARETKKPSEVIELGWEDEKTLEIEDKIKEHSLDSAWHYSDEENFSDLKKRITELLEFIESQEEQNVLLISHGLLSKFIFAMMLFGEKLTPSEYYSIQDFLKTENTGITVCRKKKDRWELMTWNDHAHLG